MQQWTIEEMSMFSNSSNLEWRQGCRTQFWKGPTQGLVSLGSAVSEKIKLWKFTTYDDDGRQVMAKAHLAFGQVS